ncbi:MAG: DUF4982 domain-containing protein [Coprobacter sp.]|nr:DUF4982 domain-containing protein [Coprobacter sp.]
MNRKKYLLLVPLCAFALGTFAQSAGRTAFNHNWTFEKDGITRQLDLPHDWGVEGTFEQVYPGETGKLAWWGSARYTKHLEVTPAEQAGGTRFLLDIDGAMSDAKVYCNDTLVTAWPYGYASFRADLTPCLHVGSNEIAITLDNLENSSRWYPGGGIYRNVWLVREAPVSVGHWGTSITAEPLGPREAAVTLRITLESQLEPVVGTVITRILDGDRILAEAETKDTLADGRTLEQHFRLSGIERWSVDTPKRYTARTTVVNPDGRKAVYDTPFGIRTAEFRPDGFYLNGQKTFLKGVCLHHDSGALGAVWNTTAWERRLQLLKEMGCNSIRTSHNPPAPELLDLCDRMGFLVMDEFADTWILPKKPNGYAKLFDQWAEKDLVAFIHRDRNHPSVILWSIGNECEEQGSREHWWVPLTLADICHREDPTRPVTAGSNNLAASRTPYHATHDVYGFNYKPHAYQAFHQANPLQPVLGSETASCVSTRGYYAFPVSDDKSKGWVDGTPYQVSSYDLYAPGWASCPDYEWAYEDQAPFLAGEYVWTGIDYLGEPTPYNVDWSILTNFHNPEEKARAEAALKEQAQTPPPARSSYFGIIDLAGFPKDRFYLYQSRWRADLPMAHILPHWNWAGREGEITPVHVYTSGDSAELFINGKSQGLKTKGRLEYRLRWDDVRYEPGTVEVVAYKDGKEWARDQVHTTGRAARLNLAEDYAGDDLIYIRVEVADPAGNLVPDACNTLSFSLSGPGKIVACDAGDPTTHIPFWSTTLPALNGLCSVIVRRTGDGPITLRAQSKGLKSARIRLDRK